MKKFDFIDTNLIDLPVREVRIDRNPNYVQDITESIRQNGILQPLLLRPKGERFEVIAGSTRLIAARALRLPKVPAMVRDAGDRETIIFRMHENLIRENPDPVAEARFIANSLLDLGVDVPEFAKMLGRSEGYVEDRLAIAEMPDHLQQAIKNKEIALGVALCLNQIDSEQTRQDWTFAAIRDGMTVEAAQNALREFRRLQSMSRNAASPEDIPIIPDEPPEILVRCEKCGQPMSLLDARVVRVHKSQCPPPLETAER